MVILVAGGDADQTPMSASVRRCAWAWGELTKEQPPRSGKSKVENRIAASLA
jgi:hypothetical protein